MKLKAIFFTVSFIFVSCVNSNGILNTKKINTTKIREIIKDAYNARNINTMSGLLWDKSSKCIIFNKCNYCITDDKKWIYKVCDKRKYDKKFKIEVYSYKSGKILKEGYGIINDGSDLTGIWKIYDYKKRKIRYINFDKEPRISKKAVEIWAKKQYSKGLEQIHNSIINNKRAWFILFDSMSVFIDANSGKFIKYQFDMGKDVHISRETKCVNREFIYSSPDPIFSPRWRQTWWSILSNFYYSTR